MAEPTNGKPQRELGAASALFAKIWLSLDNSSLRPVWPFALGGVVAGAAVMLVQPIWLAAAVTVVVFLVIALWGRSVARRLEEIHRLQD